MYEVQLMNSYFPAQDDADLRDITIGDFLQETADAFPDNVAMVDIDDNGDACDDDLDGDGINNCDEWFNGDTPLGNNQIEDEINGSDDS